jgi:2-C-methyl-D-erythritol 4-phosphate cytidylyltransferase
VKAQLVIPAAGMGTRLGTHGPKALIDLRGKPLLVRALARFQPLGLVNDAVLVIPPGMLRSFREALSPHYPEARFMFIDGGSERQHSVAKGLAALHMETEIVVIHDAARPFVSPSSVTASIEAAKAFGAATVAVPTSDTILVGDEHAFLIDTPDRRTLWACQTPQTFRVDVIRKAHEAAEREGFVGTDDASLVRRTGGRVKLVHGSAQNMKITTPGDLALALAVVEAGLV